MYNSDNLSTDNVIPLSRKSTKKSTKYKKKSRENITIIPSKVNDVFNRVSIKETYCKLVMLADESGTLIIRIRTLAKFLNTGEKTISRNLKELHIRGLIIKDKFLDEYDYQKMIIHIVNYNKLSEKDTYVGKPGEDVVGQIVNNQLYDRNTAGQIINRQLYETLPKSNELTKDFDELTNKIQESGSPYNEIQMFDKRIKTDDRKAHTSEHDIILANQPPLPSHKPTASVSGAVFYLSDNNQKTSDQDVDYLVRLIMGFGTKEGQAKQMIDIYGYDVVLDKVNYVKSLEGIDRKGGYLIAVLKAHGKKNGIAPPHKLITPEEKQASEARKKLCQEHWENIDNFWKKNYKAFESYQNNRLDEHRGIIFKTLEILNSNPRAYPNYPLYEDLNGKTITPSNLRIICDRLIGENPNQLMEENKNSQEPSKNIVSQQSEKANKNVDASSQKPIEKANKPTEKTSTTKAHTSMSLHERLAKVNRDLTNTVVGKTSLIINQNKEKTAAEKEAYADKQRQIAAAILANSPKPKIEIKENIQSQTENVQSQIRDAHNKEKPNVHNSKQSNITQRQQEILDYICVGKSADQKSIENKYVGINEKTIRRDIKALLDKGFITWQWENRKKIYHLN